MSKIIQAPNLGVDSADVIELLVAEGDVVSKEQGLILVESDKATMEIPSTIAGVVLALRVKVGESIHEGSDIVEIEVEEVIANQSEEQPTSESSSPVEPTPETVADSDSESESESEQPPVSAVHIEDIVAPDLGVASATVIEALVEVGDTIAQEQGLVLLESDKASIEFPSPYAGTLTALMVSVGDNMSEGTLVARIETDTQTETKTSQPDTGKQTPVSVTAKSTVQSTKETAQSAQRQTAAPQQVSVSGPQGQGTVYAGPGVRQLARELGVDLTLLQGNGRNGRVLKEDVTEYVKHQINQPAASTTQGSQSLDDRVDFTQFGEISRESMPRLHQLTADAMARSWTTVPRVTQFDQADITDLEDFRKQTNNAAENKASGIRLTLLSFLVRASARALQKYPQFNVSVDGHQIIQKHYCHIGIAVDTPSGLMVPVIRNADSKGLVDIAAEIRELAGKARDKKLSPDEMQGGCFSISSLGGIAGTGFTPIVNHPEVAIMGVANSSMQPVWNGSEFCPRLICPLSLSYDHRAVNGADAARFLGHIAQMVSDIRSLLL